MDAEPVLRPDMQGRRVILWLFVLLAAATGAGLWMFSLTDEGATAKPTVWRALAGDLALPVTAWFILHGIGETTSRRRWMWWGASLLAGAVTYLLVSTILLLALA